MAEDNKTINEEKIREAYSKNIKLHLRLRNGNWRNGVVRECGSDIFIFEDVINGREAMFFMELEKVEPYIERE